MNTPIASSPQHFAVPPAVPRARPGTAAEESAASASRYEVPSGFLWLADVVVFAAAFVIAWRATPLLQHLWSAEHLGSVWILSRLSPVPAANAAGIRPLTEIAWVLLVMAPLSLLVMQLLGGYRPLLTQSRVRVFITSFGAPLGGLSAITLVLVAVRNQSTSRALIFSLTLLAGLGLLAHRALIRRYKRQRLQAGHYARNVVVVAPLGAAQSLAAHFAAHVDPRSYRLSGHLTLPGAGAAPSALPALPCLGDVAGLGDLMVHRPIHEVIAVLSAGHDDWLKAVVEQCEFFRVTLRLVPESLLSWNSRDLPVTADRDGLRLPQVVLRPRYLDDGSLFVKRLFDIVVSFLLLVALLPLFALIALAIKLTSPRLTVFYPWRVVGYKGRPFTGYKFTTMVADADDRKASLEHLNEMSGPVFKIKDDPRITPLGRILRKFSLNELPQLWSVLKGDMSLVGPRPAGPHELARYELWHKRKLSVQPGVTCLWQVRGRNRISNFDDWVRMDFEYIDQWSLWLDLKILARTAWTVLAGSGS